jgi:hypothetical protein
MIAWWLVIEHGVLGESIVVCVYIERERAIVIAMERECVNAEEAARSSSPALWRSISLVNGQTLLLCLSPGFSFSLPVPLAAPFPAAS